MSDAKRTPAAEEPAPPPTPADIAATEQGLETTTPAAPPGRAPVRMGVMPASIEDAWRLARFIAESDMVPKGYKKRPADVLVAIQLGAELGLPPMAALQSIFVANGHPSLYGDGFLAVLLASPHYQDHDEYFLVNGERRELLVAADMQRDDTAAVCTFHRVGRARPVTATFSIANAKKAGLWTKAGPWTEYAARMLKLRARGFAGRDCFADVLRGIRIEAEVNDLPPDDAPPPVVVQRRSEQQREATVADAPPIIEPVRIGPAVVARVEAFLNDYTITLADGTQIDTADATNALDLEKLKASKAPVNFECTSDNGRLHLIAFAVAE